MGAKWWTGLNFDWAEPRVEVVVEDPTKNWQADAAEGFNVYLFGRIPACRSCGAALPPLDTLAWELHYGWHERMGGA